MSQQIIEQFFVPIKKVKPGEDPRPAPIELKKKKATQPIRLGSPQLQEWMKKHARKGR